MVNAINQCEIFWTFEGGSGAARMMRGLCSKTLRSVRPMSRSRWPISRPCTRCTNNSQHPEVEWALSTCGQVWKPDLRDWASGDTATVFIYKVSALQSVPKKGLKPEPLGQWAKLSFSVFSRRGLLFAFHPQIQHSWSLNQWDFVQNAELTGQKNQQRSRVRDKLHCRVNLRSSLWTYIKNEN